MQDQPSPFNNEIMKLVTSFAHLQVMSAIVETGISEQLKDGPASLQELSECCNLDAGVLPRVLRYASGINLITSNNDRYQLTKSGRLLIKDEPDSIYDIIVLMGSEPWQKAWNNLSHSLQTGESAFEDAVGMPFFEYTKKHTKHADIFDDWMTVESQMTADLIPEVYDFSDCESICDIGGSRGILLKSILQSNPDLQGILFDKAEVVENHELNDIKRQVDIRGGDFFESVPRADVLIMKHIIHDWKDEQAVQILQTCKESMDDDTRLLLIERVLDEDTGMSPLFFDLHMQVMNAGKERTADEFEALLQEAGLSLNQIIPTDSPVMVLEASL
ncbi:methyltransferase [Fodinibius halophilus]|uniref:Uncharacterized protein n=1 Tax=Fodinibius halophilus TaxID=1736908 RepID=A0A6M1THQ6_9BACT|nr:methyltransferase [Fodinibius halophilus]NGP89642.1 hypothetical protein [Fodinibius halophilus]